jgi:hypothetical protein
MRMSLVRLIIVSSLVTTLFMTLGAASAVADGHWTVDSVVITSPAYANHTVTITIHVTGYQLPRDQDRKSVV